MADTGAAKSCIQEEGKMRESEVELKLNSMLVERL